MDLTVWRHEARHASVAQVTDVTQEIRRQEAAGRWVGEFTVKVLNWQLVHVVRQHSDDSQATQHDVVVVNGVEVFRRLRRAGQRLCHRFGRQNVMRKELWDAVVGEQERHAAVAHVANYMIERRRGIVISIAGATWDRRRWLGVVVFDVCVIVIHAIAVGEGQDAVAIDARGIQDNLSVAQGDGVGCV